MRSHCVIVDEFFHDWMIGISGYLFYSEKREETEGTVEIGEYHQSVYIRLISWWYSGDSWCDPNLSDPIFFFSFLLFEVDMVISRSLPKYGLYDMFSFSTHTYVGTLGLCQSTDVVKCYSKSLYVLVQTSLWVYGVLIVGFHTFIWETLIVNKFPCPRPCSKSSDSYVTSSRVYPLHFRLWCPRLRR